jgi:hypothetical protein
MPDFYPSEKGVIRRDRTGEARDVLARELMYESLGMIPVGGMAAKMSSPAVDVLGRWIRRFRKDKPPTVPEKVIDKAIRHEEVRRGQLRFDPQTGEQLKYGDPTIMESVSRGSSSGRRSLGEMGEIERPLGFMEKDDFDLLEDFMLKLRRLPDPATAELSTEEIMRHLRSLPPIRLGR